MSIRMRRKLWRKMMNDEDVALLRAHQGEHWPAVVRNKAMLTPSSCREHPKYQAKRLPTSGCQECLAIFGEVQKAK